MRAVDKHTFDVRGCGRPSVKRGAKFAGKPIARRRNARGAFHNQSLEGDGDKAIQQTMQVGSQRSSAACTLDRMVGSQIRHHGKSILRAAFNLSMLDGYVTAILACPPIDMVMRPYLWQTPSPFGPVHAQTATCCPEYQALGVPQCTEPHGSLLMWTTVSPSFGSMEHD